MQFEDKFYMIDQHAAHEKVLYERTVKTLANKEITSQMVSPPMILTLNMQEAAKLGFETVILPASNVKGLKVPAGIRIVGIRSLQEAALQLSE